MRVCVCVCIGLCGRHRFRCLHDGLLPHCHAGDSHHMFCQCSCEYFICKQCFLFFPHLFHFFIYGLDTSDERYKVNVLVI